MSNVQRICNQCGGSNPVEARYCAHCGFDSQSMLPAARSALPLSLGQAALPVLIGAAGLAVRAGWRLLQSQWVRDLAQRALAPRTAQPPAPVPPSAPARPKRTMHIRSAWAVNDGQGNWRKGMSEHTIELED